MKPARWVPCLIVTLSGLAVVAPIASAAPPDKVERLEILDRSIAFHGGDAYLRSEVSFTLSSSSGDFQIVARRDGGLFDYRVTREREAGRSVYRHRNEPSGRDTVERWEAGEPVELDDASRQRARDYVSQRVYFAFLPFRWNDPSTYKQDLGIEDWNGRRLRKVKVSFEPGSSSSASSEFMLWLDPETARLEQFAYSFSGGMRFRPLRNYREIGGILFFDQENYALDGSGLSVDALSPTFVAARMSLLSVVKLDAIEVRPIE